MSASVCLAGMFPPTDEQIWNQNLTWKPVPIHSVPLEIDTVVHATVPCPRFDRAMKKYLISPEFTAIIENHQQLFKYLEEKTELQMDSLDTVEFIYNALWIENLKNKT